MEYVQCKWQTPDEFAAEENITLAMTLTKLCYSVFFLPPKRVSEELRSVNHQPSNDKKNNNFNRQLNQAKLRVKRRTSLLSRNIIKSNNDVKFSIRYSQINSCAGPALFH